MDSNNHNITYKLNISHNSDFIEFDVSIEFNDLYDNIYFKLGEDYQISVCEGVSNYSRNASLVIIQQSNHTIRCTYGKKNNGQKFFLQGSGWLITPTDEYHITDLFVNSNCPYLLGNAYKLYGFYNPNRISLFFPDNYSLLLTQKAGKLTCHQDLPENLYISEITRFISFYKDIMSEEPEFNVAISDEIPARCISMRGLILCKQKMLNKDSVFLFQYLFHEIIHQFIGNELIFEGYGRLWLKESLTEYLQTYYLLVRFGEKLYIQRISGYLQKYNKYKHYEIPMMQIGEEYSDLLFNATFASKGILLFHYLLHGVGLSSLSDTLIKLKSYERNITINDFLDILDESIYPNKECTIFYLQNNGIPQIGGIENI